MSPSLGWIASGTNEDGESADRGTGCANVRTSGSVGAPGWQQPGATWPGASWTDSETRVGRADRSHEAN
jgi:hypothetical protein